MWKEVSKEEALKALNERKHVLLLNSEKMWQNLIILKPEFKGICENFPETDYFPEKFVPDKYFVWEDVTK